MRKLLMWLVLGLPALALLSCSGEAAATEPFDPLEAGRTHLDAGEYAEAIVDLQAAVEADPDGSEPHFLLGKAYFQAGYLNEAADEFRAVLALDPNSAPAHHNLGVTYLQLGIPGAAVSEFEAALELDPDDPTTHYQLGMAYLILAFPSQDPSIPPNAQSLELAAAEFEVALELEADMPEALIGMGRVYIEQGRYAEAVELLQRAVEQLPSSPEAHYALAEAYALNGEIERACETYARLLELTLPPELRSHVEQQMDASECP